MVKRTTGMLTTTSQESVKTLQRLHDSSNPPGVQLRAARSVLQLGMKQREYSEREERLAESERRAAEGNALPRALRCPSGLGMAALCNLVVLKRAIRRPARTPK